MILRRLGFLPRGVLLGTAVFASWTFAPEPAVAEVPIDDEQAEVFVSDQIEIVDPWAKAVVGGGNGTKVFFEFRNRGASADRLIGARSTLAERCVLRLASQINGQATVKAVPAIDFPAGGEAFELSEHGYYIELTGVSAPLTMGKLFRLELEFAHTRPLTIEVTSRFHSPKLARRIRDAARRGDTATLRSLREQH